MYMYMYIQYCMLYMYIVHVYAAMCVYNVHNYMYNVRTYYTCMFNIPYALTTNT